MKPGLEIGLLVEVGAADDEELRFGRRFSQGFVLPDRVHQAFMRFRTRYSLAGEQNLASGFFARVYRTTIATHIDSFKPECSSLPLVKFTPVLAIVKLRSR
jgi:hypothetical protein